jgi:putative transposase
MADAVTSIVRIVVMTRPRRSLSAGIVYHVLNRAAKKAPIFWTEQDYDAFLGVVAEAKRRIPVRIFAYIAMPNHWHFLIEGSADGAISRFMHWLTTTHATRWNIAHSKRGEGAVYQSRFKAIAVQDGLHLFRVWRYVERNALRSNLVTRAEEWRWSSLAAPRDQNTLLDPSPLLLPADWIDVVNEPQNESEIAAIRSHTNREIPYGDAEWEARFGRHAGARGRPTKYVKRGSDPVHVSPTRTPRCARPPPAPR